jgi:hypothetical protein
VEVFGEEPRTETVSTNLKVVTLELRLALNTPEEGPQREANLCCLRTLGRHHHTRVVAKPIQPPLLA